MNKFPISVAIIDDDDLYRAILVKLFERSGMTVVFRAENGRAGVDQMKNCSPLPLIVIVDIEMPVMDGFETARHVRAHWPEVGIVAHSSLTDQEAGASMVHAGADVFLSKAAGIKELVKTVEKLAVSRRCNYSNS
jgi:DNA-binding NarL/FixJ family response regulator